jgi:hypothetical protein
VCGSRGCTVFIDTHATTLREFVDKVLKGALNFNTPSVDNGSAFVFLEEREEGEDDEEYELKMSFLGRPLAGLVGGGLGDGTIASITDFSQDLQLQLTVRHRSKEDFDELKHPQFFELVGDVDAKALEKTLDAEAASAKRAGDGSGAGAASSSSSAAASSSSSSVGAVAGAKRPRDAVADAAGGPAVLDLVDDDEEEEKPGTGAGADGQQKRARPEAGGGSAGGAASTGGAGAAGAGRKADDGVLVIDDDE